MDRFTTKENVKPELLDCVYCPEHSNCYSNMSCNAIYNALSKLRYYENLEEQGRLVVLPCKIGDTVYRVMADKRIKHPYECKVIGFWYSADETCNNVHLVRYVNGVFDCSMSVPFSEFNRILFLTKEEAEAALNNA